MTMGGEENSINEHDLISEIAESSVTWGIDPGTLSRYKDFVREFFRTHASEQADDSVFLVRHPDTPHKKSDKEKDPSKHSHFLPYPAFFSMGEGGWSAYKQSAERYYNLLGEHTNSPEEFYRTMLVHIDAMMCAYIEFDGSRRERKKGATERKEFLECRTEHSEKVSEIYREKALLSPWHMLLSDNPEEQIESLNLYLWYMDGSPVDQSGGSAFLNKWLLKGLGESDERTFSQPEAMVGVWIQQNQDDAEKMEVFIKTLGGTHVLEDTYIWNLLPANYREHGEGSAQLAGEVAATTAEKLDSGDQIFDCEIPEGLSDEYIQHAARMKALLGHMGIDRHRLIESELRITAEAKRIEQPSQQFIKSIYSIDSDIPYLLSCSASTELNIESIISLLARDIIPCLSDYKGTQKKFYIKSIGYSEATPGLMTALTYYSILTGKNVTVIGGTGGRMSTLKFQKIADPEMQSAGLFCGLNREVIEGKRSKGLNMVDCFNYGLFLVFNLRHDVLRNKNMEWILGLTDSDGSNIFIDPWLAWGRENDKFQDETFCEAIRYFFGERLPEEIAEVIEGRGQIDGAEAGHDNQPLNEVAPDTAEGGEPMSPFDEFMSRVDTEGLSFEFMQELERKFYLLELFGMSEKSIKSTLLGDIKLVKDFKGEDKSTIIKSYLEAEGDAPFPSSFITREMGVDDFIGGIFSILEREYTIKKSRKERRLKSSLKEITYSRFGALLLYVTVKKCRITTSYQGAVTDISTLDGQMHEGKKYPDDSMIPCIGVEVEVFYERFSGDEAKFMNQGILSIWEIQHDKLRDVARDWVLSLSQDGINRVLNRWMIWVGNEGVAENGHFRTVVDYFFGGEENMPESVKMVLGIFVPPTGAATTEEEVEVIPPASWNLTPDMIAASIEKSESITMDVNNPKEGAPYEAILKLDGHEVAKGDIDQPIDVVDQIHPGRNFIKIVLLEDDKQIKTVEHVHEQPFEAPVIMNMEELQEQINSRDSHLLIDLHNPPENAQYQIFWRINDGDVIRENAVHSGNDAEVLLEIPMSDLAGQGNNVRLALFVESDDIPSEKGQEISLDVTKLNTHPAPTFNHQELRDALNDANTESYPLYSKNTPDSSDLVISETQESETVLHMKPNASGGYELNLNALRDLFDAEGRGDVYFRFETLDEDKVIKSGEATHFIWNGSLEHLKGRTMIPMSEALGESIRNGKYTPPTVDQAGMFVFTYVTGDNEESHVAVPIPSNEHLSREEAREGCAEYDFEESVIATINNHISSMVMDRERERVQKIFSAGILIQGDDTLSELDITSPEMTYTHTDLEIISTGFEESVWPWRQEEWSQERYIGVPARLRRFQVTTHADSFDMELSFDEQGMIDGTTLLVVIGGVGHMGNIHFSDHGYELNFGEGTNLTDTHKPVLSMYTSGVMHMLADATIRSYIHYQTDEDESIGNRNEQVWDGDSNEASDQIINFLNTRNQHAGKHDPVTVMCLPEGLAAGPRKEEDFEGGLNSVREIAEMLQEAKRKLREEEELSDDELNTLKKYESSSIRLRRDTIRTNPSGTHEFVPDNYAIFERSPWVYGIINERIESTCHFSTEEGDNREVFKGPYASHLQSILLQSGGFLETLYNEEGFIDGVIEDLYFEAGDEEIVRSRILSTMGIVDNMNADRIKELGIRLGQEKFAPFEMKKLFHRIRETQAYKDFFSGNKVARDVVTKFRENELYLAYEPHQSVGLLDLFRIEKILVDAGKLAYAFNDNE